MATDESTDPQGNRSSQRGSRTTNTPSRTNTSEQESQQSTNRTVQSDDSAFYAFGEEWDLPPPMSPAFANFLQAKGQVPTAFVKEFEQAALVNDMVSFMRWFSMGTTYDVAQRFGIEFCLKYPIQIAKLGILYEFLKIHPLERSPAGAQEPYVLTSFKTEEWWPFMQMQRRHIKSYWDTAFEKLTQDTTEKYNPDTHTASPNKDPNPPRYIAPTDNLSKASGLTSEHEANTEREKKQEKNIYLMRDKRGVAEKLLILTVGGQT